MFFNSIFALLNFFKDSVKLLFIKSEQDFSSGPTFYLKLFWGVVFIEVFFFTCHRCAGRWGRGRPVQRPLAEQQALHWLRVSLQEEKQGLQLPKSWCAGTPAGSPSRRLLELWSPAWFLGPGPGLQQGSLVPPLVSVGGLAPNNVWAVRHLAGR